MFEKDLLAKLKSIFGVKKVTYNAPDYDALEQDCVFVEIETVKPRMTADGGGRQTAIVLGALIIFSEAERLPYGFFAKRVENSDAAITKGFFFEPEKDQPQSPARLVNMHERRVQFQFLYDSQYDPDRGELTSLETELTFEE